ncbi:MAG: D-cysteine desulfhydrase family protein [Anaerolineaceae bacterium]
MLPKVSIAHLPTPLEPLPRLSVRLGGPNLYIKRDDLTGLALGGNKTRKLEFLIAEAQANGAKMLITAGATQSNHCRQTAAAAARFGFTCILVLAGEKPQIKVGNTLLDSLMGAKIIWTSKDKRDEVLQSTFDANWEKGHRPYLIPYGGSSATGVAAYAYALQELLIQQDSIDWLVLASSSGGTQAGLLIGAGMCGWHGKILGISVDEPESILIKHVQELVSAGSSKMNLNTKLSPTSIRINDNYLGEGYGVMGQPEKEAIQLFAKQEGIILDPVYTGRAAAGLIDLIGQGFFKKDEKVVFWHTGGTPALFASQYTDALQ